MECVNNNGLSSGAVSPMNTSPAPMLSELGKKQVEEVFHETGLSSGEKVTQEIASAMHVDFFQVSAYSGRGITAMFERIARQQLRGLVVTAPLIAPKKPTKKTVFGCCFPRKQWLYDSVLFVVHRGGTNTINQTCRTKSTREQPEG